MVLRHRTVHRLTGLMARWGLIEHPYGQEYARQRYTFTGRRRPDEVFASSESAQTRPQTRGRAAFVIAALVLASLLATGLLFSL